MATLSKKVLNELAAEEAAAQSNSRDHASSVVSSPDAEQQDNGSPRFSHAPYGYHAVPAQYRTVNTGASTPPELDANNNSGLMNPFAAASENNDNNNDDTSSAPSYLYSGSTEQSRVVTQVAGSGHSFSSFKHLSPQTVAKLNRNHQQQQQSHSSSGGNQQQQLFVDPRSSAMSFYKQSSTQHESNADAAASYLMNTSGNSTSGSNSHTIHTTPNNSPNHSVRGTSSSPNTIHQQQQQGNDNNSYNNSLNSSQQQQQQPVYARRGFSLRHQVAAQQQQDTEQQQQQHTVEQQKPTSPTTSQAPPSYGETISTTTPVPVYNQQQPQECDNNNNSDNASVVPAPSGPGAFLASNDSGLFNQSATEVMGSSYNSSVPPSPMTMAHSNNRSFTTTYGGSAPQIPPALAIAHLGGSFSSPAACGTPTPNTASLKRTLSNASVKTSQSYAESSATGVTENQQQQPQQPRKKKNKNASGGTEPSTPSKPRMDVSNPNFKAHVGLEQHDIPYFSFPNGGTLPKPAHWPVNCTIDAVGDAPSHRAFIGQVRFETTAEQIAFIIEAVTGVTVSFIANHRNGCFVAHFYSAEDCQTAVDQHKMILFDLHGVWQMQKDNEAHKTAVQAVLKNKSVLHRYRLPRGCMVIEHFTSSRNSNGVPDANAAPRQPTVPVYHPQHHHAAIVAHHQQQQHQMMMGGYGSNSGGMMMMSPRGYLGGGGGMSSAGSSYLFGGGMEGDSQSEMQSVCVNASFGGSQWVEGEEFEASAEFHHQQ